MFVVFEESLVFVDVEIDETELEFETAVKDGEEVLQVQYDNLYAMCHIKHTEKPRETLVLLLKDQLAKRKVLSEKRGSK